MKRTERITRVIQRQGVESVVIPPAFHLEATAVVVRREGERLVLIPLAGPGTSRQGHAPKPRPNLTTIKETRETTASRPTFEVIGGPYPRFRKLERAAAASLGLGDAFCGARARSRSRLARGLRGGALCAGRACCGTACRGRACRGRACGRAAPCSRRA